MTRHESRGNPTLLALALSSLFTGTALAQAAPDRQIPEVVVTAQRTASLESKTPVAMSVLTGEQLGTAGIATVSDLASRLPNVHMDGSYDGLKITIRGVSNADTTEKGDPSAAFMLDGIYIARPQGQNLGLYDIDRVEVLRGPQGTLYGRNTTAGVVNVISNAPTRKFEAAVSAEAGSYARRMAGAMLNVPVNDNLALRAALATHRHDSYLINGQGTSHHLGLDRDERFARLSAKLDMGRDASLVLRYDHTTLDDDNDSFVPDTNFFDGVAAGAPVWKDASTDARLTNGFRAPNGVPEQGRGHRVSAGLGAELTWKLGPATLYYLGSHRTLDDDFLVNYYYRIAPTFALGVREYFTGAYTQNSHELRVEAGEGGPLSMQAGLYWFREESNMVYTFRDLELLQLPPYYVFPHGPAIARSKAVFGQATWRMTDWMRLTAGLRYTDDDKSRIGSTNFQQGPTFNPATDLRLLNAASMNTHKTTWRAGLEADLAPRTLVYGTVATGYKAGGFNDGCLAGSSALGIECPAPVAVSAATLYYRPETLTSYEAGFKSRFWDNKASLNVAAFYYDYTNLQLSSVAVVMGAPRYVTSNAGEASVKGLEADGQASLTAGGRLTYALTLLDAHYVSYSPDGIHSWAGKKLDRAPSSTFTLGYEQRFRFFGGMWKAGVLSRTSSAYSIGVPTQQLEYRIPSRTQTDASLGYQPEGAAWSVLARVKNMENKVQPITIDSFGMVVPSAPRTVDLRVDYRF
ncbi:MAG TPA: TonB-dependent receptor [Telluria sp.]|nr:TonB-dependent receptor [Telluria sp.]